MQYENQSFDGTRSQMYAKAMREYPDARKEDIAAILKIVNPAKSDNIAEFGAGTGFISHNVYSSCNELHVSDPSKDQIEHIKKENNIYPYIGGAEADIFPKNYFDKIYSFGNFHHCNYQQQAITTLGKNLKKGGILTIIDVLQGSPLADHFDSEVHKHSVTQHEVKFLSKRFFDSLCFNGKLTTGKIEDLSIQWEFNSEADIGQFIYDLHGMTGTNQEGCLKSAQEMLGIEEKQGKYYLNRPLTAFQAIKD